jgi:ribosome-associated protein
MTEDLDESQDVMLDYVVRPNKTEIKREISVILAMAEAMTALSLSQLSEFELPEAIFNALVRVMKMPHKNARKREMKYITAQFRTLNLAPIQEKLARINSHSVHALREHHQAEQWREQLINDANNVYLTQFLRQYPKTNRQQLRQLQREARKELTTKASAKFTRLLYQYLKNILIVSKEA